MYLILFLFSLLMALPLPSIYNNFTYLSYTPPWKIPYIIWALSLAFFIGYKVLQLFTNYSYILPYQRRMYHIIWCCFVIGLLLPYTPNTNSLSSTLHVIFSSSGLLYLGVLIKVFIVRIQTVNSTIFIKIDQYFNWGLVMIFTLCLFFGSITIVVELFFIFLLMSLLHMMEKALTK